MNSPLELLKHSLWRQFGAALDMLQNAIEMCPEEVWRDEEDSFWYVTYHTLFWLDYYLDDDPKNFAPIAPYTLSEFDPNEILPDTTYTQIELLGYLDHGRAKCKNKIEGLTEDNVNTIFKSEKKPYNQIEILLYNLRHIQHHVGQLNLLLRQRIYKAPKWVSRIEE